jgi:hypothetical protein
MSELESVKGLAKHIQVALKPVLHYLPKTLGGARWSTS